MEIKPIATIHTELPQKFGIPRQAGLVPELTGRIILEPDYRDPAALRGLADYDYIWLIWGFDGQAAWSPTVRPPRLGGQVRMGVFATRSPNRPNRIGLSSVRLLSVELEGPDGPAIIVGGADLRDGTKIYDIKPYVPYADSHPESAGGFTDQTEWKKAEVEFPDQLLEKIDPSMQEAARGILENDPRGPYEKKPGSVYGLRFGDWEIRFRSREDGSLLVTDVLDGEDTQKCK